MIMIKEHFLVGRIAGLRVLWVPEFGTRASFRLQYLRECLVTCCVAGALARELVLLRGRYGGGERCYEPRRSTASPKTPWAGRFRVRDLHIANPASIACLR
jgi:hypothetical protein